MPPKKKWLASFKALSTVFKAKVIESLVWKYSRNKLKLPPTLSFRSTSDFKRYCQGKREITWRTDVRPPQGGTTGAFDYMARYVFRSAIGNNRLISFHKQVVKFSITDRKTQEKKIVQLTAKDFMQRLAQHILPKGFTRVRWYGILSCARRKIDTALVRGILNNHKLAITRKAFLKLSEALRLRLEQRKCQQCGAEKLHFKSFRTALTIWKDIFQARWNLSQKGMEGNLLSG